MSAQSDMHPDLHPDRRPDKPLVSVIVPAYNGGRFLRAALRSILDQDYRPLEIIVVDDGSTDNTAEVAGSFFGITYERREHSGVSAARNAGLGRAHGGFISFLDADDLWTPQKTSLQMAFLREHPDGECVSGYSRCFREPGVATPGWLPKKYFEERSAANSSLCALLARRGVFEKVGLFNEKLGSGEDMDWFMRLRDAGIAMEMLPDVLLLRRFHDKNMTYQVHGGDRSHLIEIFKASIRRKRENEREGKE